MDIIKKKRPMRDTPRLSDKVKWKDCKLSLKQGNVVDIQLTAISDPPCQLTYLVSRSVLPNGLYITPQGLLHDIPTDVGPYNFMINAITPNGDFTEKQFTGEIVAGNHIHFSSATIHLKQYKKYVMQYSNSENALTYSAHWLPQGLSLTPAGFLSGAPTTSGPYNFIVITTDGVHNHTINYSGIIEPTEYSNTINGIEFLNNPLSLYLSQKTNVEYQISVKNKDATFKAIDLVSGLSISYDGKITGSPIGFGPYHFVVEVSTPTSKALQEFSGSIKTVMKFTNNPDDLVLIEGKNVSYKFTTDNSAYLPVKFTTEILPVGLTLNSTGELSGAPKHGGKYNFTVTATDGYTTINQVLGGKIEKKEITKISPAKIKLVKDKYISTKISNTITSTSGLPIKYAVIGDLPYGLTLTHDGNLHGTPTIPGPYNFVVTASDSIINTSAHINGVVNFVSFTVVPEIILIQNKPIKQNIILKEENQYSNEIKYSAKNLPAGLSLSSSGILTGTPKEHKQGIIQVIAEDVEKTLNYKILKDEINFEYEEISLIQYKEFSLNLFSSISSTSGLKVKITAVSIPEGTKLNTKGVFSGRVKGASGKIKVKLNNGFCEKIIEIPYTVSEDLITNFSCLEEVIDIVQSIEFDETQIVENIGKSSSGLPIIYKAPSLPVGMTLSETGILSGTPIDGKSGKYKIIATDGYAIAESQIEINFIKDEIVEFECIPEILLVHGNIYEEPFAIYKNPGTSIICADVTYSIDILPEGLTLSSTGFMSGIPTVYGIFNTTVTVSDELGISVSAPMKIICDAIIDFEFPTTMQLKVGQSTSGFVYSKLGKSVAGFDLSYSINGVLPAGVYISPKDAKISGTPSLPGTTYITVLVKNAESSALFISKKIAIVVSPMDVKNSSSVSLTFSNGTMKIR